MRLIEERRGSAVISYVYEPGSYVPLARLDAEGERTEQGGLGTTHDVQQPQTSKTIAASAGQANAGGRKDPNYSQQPANDTLEASYWQALNSKGTAQGTGTGGPSANAKLCEVYYFHTDQGWACPKSSATPKARSSGKPSTRPGAARSKNAGKHAACTERKCRGAANYFATTFTAWSDCMVLNFTRMFLAGTPRRTSSLRAAVARMRAMSRASTGASLRLQ